jgi:hypothetical protein
MAATTADTSSQHAQATCATLTVTVGTGPVQTVDNTVTDNTTLLHMQHCFGQSKSYAQLAMP